jgi:hypothetical protein
MQSLGVIYMLGIFALTCRSPQPPDGYTSYRHLGRSCICPLNPPILGDFQVSGSPKNWGARGAKGSNFSDKR